MKKNVDKLKCLFGYHEFTIPSEAGYKLCKHCKRISYKKMTSINTGEVWHEYQLYDADGGLVGGISRCMGYEVKYDFDESGLLTHCKESTGDEFWQDYDTNGNMTRYADEDKQEIIYTAIQNKWR